MDLNLIWETLRPVYLSVLAGLAYSMTGYLNYWVDQRKQNSDAPWDWKKMFGTLLVAIIIGGGIGLYQNITGTDVAVAYMFLASIGATTLLKKWISTLLYGDEMTLGVGRRIKSLIK